MEKIYILQNELKNALDRISTDLGASDDEKIVALHMALSTVYAMKETRSAYMARVEEKENNANGNSNA